MSAIFLSGTFEDLRRERNAILDVCHRLKITPISQEIFGASPKNPVEVIKSEINSDACCLYILIQGFRYGSFVPTDMIPKELPYGQRRHISFCEVEFDYARFFGKPRFVYIKNKRNRNASGINRTQQGLREKFIRKMSREHITFKYFSSCQELAVQAAIDILKFFHDIEWKKRAAGPDYET